MPKGAPGQPRTKGAGRKHSRDYDRTTIIVSQKVMDWLKRNGNISAEVEKLAREKMEEQARERINGMDFTDEQTEFIFSDWPNWDEHINWLLTASREEIISWINTSK